MTANDMTVLGLPLDTADPETAVMVESSLDWVAQNTTLKLDLTKELPSNVKLFAIKYCELMNQSVGVSSESLGGMSQSFSVTTGEIGKILADLAAQLFGSAYKGRNRFVPAVNRWK